MQIIINGLLYFNSIEKEPSCGCNNLHITFMQLTSMVLIAMCIASTLVWVARSFARERQHDLKANAGYWSIRSYDFYLGELAYLPNAYPMDPSRWTLSTPERYVRWEHLVWYVLTRGEGALPRRLSTRHSNLLRIIWVTEWGKSTANGLSDVFTVLMR